MPDDLGKQRIPASRVQVGLVSGERKRVVMDSLALYTELRLTLQGASRQQAREARMQYTSQITTLLPAPARIAHVDEALLELMSERVVWELLCICVGPSAEDGSLAEGLSTWLRTNQAALHCWVKGGGGSDSVTEAQVALVEPCLLLIRRMPHLGQDASISSVPQFVSRRQQWQGAVLGFTQSKAAWDVCRQADPATARGLGMLLNLLLGSSDAIGQATSTWLEQLVARMLYMYPGLRLQGELSALMEQCTQAQDALGCAGWTSTLQLLQAACEGICTPWWPGAARPLGTGSMAHVMDVAGPAPLRPIPPATHTAHTGTTLVESYTAQYASS
ncbi:hypothetical protein WJX73_008038 [Symbiochloris irregularis]|uniref:Nuclear pore complex protein Nup85 n=1 Tax=Symbiochloris irregularis TaxID=706552 RepID=A0AAW1NT38_9CHLO